MRVLSGPNICRRLHSNNVGGSSVVHAGHLRSALSLIFRRLFRYELRERRGDVRGSRPNCQLPPIFFSHDFDVAQNAVVTHLVGHVADAVSVPDVLAYFFENRQYIVQLLRLKIFAAAYGGYSSQDTGIERGIVRIIQPDSVDTRSR